MEHIPFSYSGEENIETDSELRNQAIDKKLEMQKLIDEVYSKTNPNQDNITTIHHKDKYFHRLKDIIIISNDKDTYSKNDRTLIGLNKEGNIVDIELRNGYRQTHSLNEPAHYRYNDDGNVHCASYFIKGLCVSKFTFNAVKKKLISLAAINNCKNEKLECLLDVIMMLSNTIARENRCNHGIKFK